MISAFPTTEASPDVSLEADNRRHSVMAASAHGTNLPAVLLCYSGLFATTLHLTRRSSTEPEADERNTLPVPQYRAYDFPEPLHHVLSEKAPGSG